MTVLHNILEIALEVAPWLLGGLLIAGLIKAWIPEARLARWLDRMGLRGLRPAALPHHRTCGFPHPAVEPGGGHGCASAKVHGRINPWRSKVRFFSAWFITQCLAIGQAPARQ